MRPAPAPCMQPGKDGVQCSAATCPVGYTACGLYCIKSDVAALFGTPPFTSTSTCFAILSGFPQACIPVSLAPPGHTVGATGHVECTLLACRLRQLRCPIAGVPLHAPAALSHWQHHRRRRRRRRGRHAYPRAHSLTHTQAEVKTGSAAPPSPSHRPPPLSKPMFWFVAQACLRTAWITRIRLCLRRLLRHVAVFY